MYEQSTSLISSFFIYILPFAILLLSFIKMSPPKATKSISTNLAKAYPVIGHSIGLYKLKRGQWFEWLVNQVLSSPSSTFVIHTPFGGRTICTGNPANVEHILKTRFLVYDKGPVIKAVFQDLFGGSLMAVSGEAWKIQRQVASSSFTPKALQFYLQNVVEFELFNRLIPMLSDAALDGRVLDFQDVLERFAFDNVCKAEFGYDPIHLDPSFPQVKLCEALNNAGRIIFMRFLFLFPIIWKICRFLNIEREKNLNDAISEIRKFATVVVKHKKESISENDYDFLSRVLKNPDLDDKVMVDLVVAGIYAGRDTTSAALTWFFWLLHCNKRVEEEIVKEIINNHNKDDDDNYNKKFLKTKEMTYTRAALFESMRLYPPVLLDPKQANRDDILPDGTLVKKGSLVYYFPYAMGRMAKLWGSDWSEFRPERWLEKEEENGKWRFVPRDPYSYPVFQAGPRTCLGKEMALLQMTMVVAAVVGRFKVVPAVEKGFEPVYVPALTAKMLGGFPVKIKERSQA